MPRRGSRFKERQKIIIPWQQFAMGLTNDTAGGEMMSVNETAAEIVAQELGSNDLYTMALGLGDGGTSGIIAAQIHQLPLSDIALEDDINISAWVSFAAGGLTAGDIFDLAATYQTVGSGEDITAMGAAWVAVDTDFTAVTAVTATHDNKTLKMTGAVIDGATLVAADRAKMFWMKLVVTLTTMDDLQPELIAVEIDYTRNRRLHRMTETAIAAGDLS